MSDASTISAATLSVRTLSVVKAAGRQPVERDLLAAATFLILLTLPLSLLLLSDGRLVDGVSTWLKPWKFAVSFSIHLATLALVWHLLAPGWRDGWKGRLLIRVLLATSLFEVGYMASQAAQGQASHYNDATPYTQLMFALMGVGAVLFVGSTFLAGVSILRSHGTVDPVLRRAIGLGLLLSGGLGLLSGVFLSVHGGHFVGTPRDAVPVVPLFGWSREVGDLRIGHFIGLHALQAMPVAGWLAARHASPQTGMRIVHGAALAIALASVATLLLALSGRPVF